ncbi:MAG: ABC transporter ATP-binding protein [Saprospiraceae bacterium]|nr:ABC transporter ATP-binding protein [Saprospiraceae bacterium]
MEAIIARSLSKTYRSGKSQTHALKGIDLDIQEGELFGLVGPDGAGKTTLIRILVSLILPDQGTASVGGLDVVRNFGLLRQQIGYVPGRFSLYQDLTVHENLHFFASVFGVNAEEQYGLVREIYKYLEPFRDRKAGQLSGGMKQKLALSCALIHRPSVLFLDEPTTGVDAVSRREFWVLLSQLRNQGMTIFVSTPYMDEAARCDRVGLIQEGRLLRIDPPTAIVRDFPLTLYALSTDLMSRVKPDLASCAEVLSAFAFGANYHLTFQTSAGPQACVRMLEQKGHTNIRLEVIQPGIEDCFMYFMKGS